jgi:hypothetical protein
MSVVTAGTMAFLLGKNIAPFRAKMFGFRSDEFNSAAERVAIADKFLLEEKKWDKWLTGGVTTLLVCFLVDGMIARVPTHESEIRTFVYAAILVIHTTLNAVGIAGLWMVDRKRSAIMGSVRFKDKSNNG